MVHALPLSADRRDPASDRETAETMTQRMEQAQECLRTRFGFEEFRPGQREVVEHLLEGRSAAAVFPTGGGKSLCYQLPALLLPGLTLVVSPLIALMKDQIDALAAKGIDAVRLDSSLDAEAHRAGTERLKSGQCKLLYVSPERFQNERFRTFVLQLPISLFAVDEAHCISEWGHSFRPDYLKLARFAQECRAERRFALTATATETVLDDICTAFDIDRQCAVRTPFYRENLLLRMTPVTASDRDRVLLAKIKERPRGATIVYVTQQKTSEQVAGFLASQGLAARAYHAGMPTLQRTETQEWFLRDAEPIIVATIAFGMGIDKPNIRYVYHYNLSKSLENYSQEIGRAGRDARSSICETLLYPDDRRVLENFAYGDTPASAAVHAMLAEIFSAGESFSVSLYDLASTHDIRELVVRTLMTYLELDEYLEGGSPFYSQYKFVPNEPSAKILQRFEGERREFLAKLFSTAYKATTWFWLDLENAMRVTGSTRQRVVAALDYLAQQNLLKLEVSLVRFAYRRKKTPEDLHELGEQYYAKLVGREQRELQRLADMMQLLTSSGCTMKRLTEYFDQSLTESCGHCGVCEAGGAAPVVPATKDQQPDYWPKRLDDDPIWRDVDALRRKHVDVLSDPRVVTRLLCGLTSPWLSKAKLTRHALFGALSDVPFHEVLKKVASG